MPRLHRILGALAALVVSLAWSPFAPRDWPALKAQVRASFPAVRHLTIAEYERLAAGERVILVDTRAAEEFAVSQIAGAIQAGDENALRVRLEGVPKDAAIVLYCSVGYRSAKLAERLARAGYTRVANLEGSMFEWANSGRDLVQGERPAMHVHPYSRTWGKFLDRRFWPERW